MVVIETMAWIDFLLDASPIIAIYGTTIPSLNGVYVHEIMLHRDGPNVMIRFDFQSYPDRPPKKWLIKDFNRVQLHLLALSIEDLQIHGGGFERKIDLNVKKIGAFVGVNARSDMFEIDLKARFLAINKISAYRADRLEK